MVGEAMARILFVDDDPHTLETLSKSVSLFGHEALRASSGEQALALAAAELPDLIITDIRLADIDGLALTRQLQDTPGTMQIPVVILSASPELEVAEAAQQAGAREFLSKHIRLNTLQEVIQRYASQ